MQNIGKKLRAGIVAVVVSSTLFGAAFMGSNSSNVDLIGRPGGEAVGLNLIGRPGGEAVGLNLIGRPGGE